LSADRLGRIFLFYLKNDWGVTVPASYD
jgi:DNA primase